MRAGTASRQEHLAKGLSTSRIGFVVPTAAALGFKGS